MTLDLSRITTFVDGIPDHPFGHAVGSFLLRRLAATQGFARPAIALAAALLAEAFLAIGWGGLALVLWLVGLGWYVASWRTRAGVVGRQAAPR